MEKVLQRVQKFMKRLKATEGVTLIELLAVVVILAIVAAVAVPAVLGQIGKSKTNADVQDEQVLADAIQRLVLDASSNGQSNLQLVTLSASSGSTAKGTALSTAANLSDVGLASFDGTNYTLIGTTTDSSTAKYDLKDLLMTGIGSGSYLNTWPIPQTQPPSSKWQVAVDPTTGLSPSQVFTVGSTKYDVWP